MNFQSFSLPVNAAVFAVAAVAVWLAGSRIAGYADCLAERTGLEKAFMGLVFLALATEMPEIATTLTASISGNASLALNNIFGGISMQTAILAVVDLALIKGALTFFTPRPSLLLQGALLMLLLGVTLVAAIAGEPFSVLNVGVWPVVLTAIYIGTLYLAYRYEGLRRWEPIEEPAETEAIKQDLEAREPHRAVAAERFSGWSTGRLIVFFVGGTLVILVSGVVLTQSGEALAEQSGLGSTFFGATLLAASTSLPEVSTTIAAVRLGSYSLAISNIFGSNGIMVVLILLSDVFYRQGPILDQIEPASMLVAAFGIVLTAIYLVGLLERRNRTVLRMGLDSAAVLALYAISLLLLYRMR